MAVLWVCVVLTLIVAVATFCVVLAIGQQARDSHAALMRLEKATEERETRVRAGRELLRERLAQRRDVTHG